MTMTRTRTPLPNCIALYTGKQGTCSDEVGGLATGFEKSAIELKPKPKFLKCKSTVSIATLNVLNKIG